MTWLDILLVTLAVLAAVAYITLLVWRNLRRKGKAVGDVGCGCHTCHFPNHATRETRKT